MSAPQPSAAADRAASRARRSTLAAALLVGLPLAAAVLVPLHYGPGRDTPAHRYVSHPVECVEVVMFCCALGALAAKVWQNLGERRACNLDLLPEWDGRPAPVSEAGPLLAEIQKAPRGLHGTWVVKRATAVLDFLCQRGSAQGLDDHLRDLADSDAVALENSYGLIRFITWAVPILGFLGTVLGITGAISGITPEKLEHSLNEVTDGLALAFDATALALALTMLTMFLSFVVERAEQGVLESVDRFVAGQLGHRFERGGADAGPFVDAVKDSSQELLKATEALVKRQAELWAETLAAADKRRSEAEARQQELLTAALEKALERTLEGHTRRLAAQERQTADAGAELLAQVRAVAETVQKAGRDQQAALARVADGMKAHAEALAGLQDGGRHLARLQESLDRNLAALAGAGAFEEAIHSLTAAIHLLTARHSAPPPPSPYPLPPEGGEGRVRGTGRTGKAA
ncbi:MAG TPA: MotA/TolQ/ExbB proton channel family protein [Gemmataceae bacterium]|nr:MotA/TolQ/ExbB proton channel family protein [Gemmataceae bacterium]